MWLLPSTSAFHSECPTTLHNTPLNSNSAKYLLSNMYVHICIRKKCWNKHWDVTCSHITQQAIKQENTRSLVNLLPIKSDHTHAGYFDKRYSLDLLNPFETLSHDSNIWNKFSVSFTKAFSQFSSWCWCFDLSLPVLLWWIRCPSSSVIIVKFFSLIPGASTNTHKINIPKYYFR